MAALIAKKNSFLAEWPPDRVCAGWLIQVVCLKDSIRLTVLRLLMMPITSFGDFLTTSRWSSPHWIYRPGALKFRALSVRFNLALSVRLNITVLFVYPLEINLQLTGSSLLNFLLKSLNLARTCFYFFFGFSSRLLLFFELGPKLFYKLWLMRQLFCNDVLLQFA